MGPTLQRIEQRIRCFLGDHELFRELVPADPDTEQPARIRLRCLHCPKVTPGWEQGRKAYAVRPGCGRVLDVPAQPAQTPAPAPVESPAAPAPVELPAAPVAQAVVKRPARKRRRHVKRPTAVRAAAVAGGRRIVNFPLARGSRSR